MKKVRKDAWGWDMPEDARWALYDLTKPPGGGEERPWLRDWRRDVLPYLSLQGIPAPSMAGWYRFLERMRVEEAQRVVLGIEGSKRIAEGVAEADIDPALAAATMTALSVDAAARRDAKAVRLFADAAKKYHDVSLTSGRLEVERDRLKAAEGQLRLAREKFEAAERRLADVRGAASAPELSDAERVERIRGIFGLK